jgi:hypothetical protein
MSPGSVKRKACFIVSKITSEAAKESHGTDIPHLRPLYLSSAVNDDAGSTPW